MDHRTNPIIIWIAALGSIAVVTAGGSALRLNPNTVGFAYLIVVLLISVWGGLLAGTVSSVVATLCYNFFFFPPLYTFTIENPANWFALVAFLVASVTVNRLVVAAHVQTEKAKQRRTELETLY
jgi:two-component system, OmpR family, sensor histidine kinase KdpD